MTRGEFVRFQELLFQRIDRNHDGKIDVEEWMGGAEAPAAAAAH